MANEKHVNKQENIEDLPEEVTPKKTKEVKEKEKHAKELKSKLTKAISDLEANEEKLKVECELKVELFDRYQRLAAEFDNYKKRTVREKDALYSDATADVIKELLPVLDNFERALSAAGNDIKDEALMMGIEMIYKQFWEMLTKIGLSKMASVGEKFDPNLHNAVMHVEDDRYGENEVVEELQAGYILKDKIVRHSYVKVAN
jgi:molecular chaperone GrpE